jgi:putative restriction endonuclease
MDRQGFIDFNTRFSPENSRKATSYAQAIRILDEVLVHQNVIDLHGQSLYDIQNAAIIEEVRWAVNGKSCPHSAQKCNLSPGTCRKTGEEGEKEPRL